MTEMGSGSSSHKGEHAYEEIRLVVWVSLSLFEALDRKQTISCNCIFRENRIPKRTCSMMTLDIRPGQWRQLCREEAAGSKEGRNEWLTTEGGRGEWQTKEEKKGELQQEDMCMYSGGWQGGWDSRSRSSSSHSNNHQEVCLYGYQVA